MKTTKGSRGTEPSARRTTNMQSLEAASRAVTPEQVEAGARWLDKEFPSHGATLTERHEKHVALVRLILRAGLE